MARAPKALAPIAASRIDYGETVNGKIVVTTFAAGDVVTIADHGVLDDLRRSGAVVDAAPIVPPAGDPADL
ncbi:hypothetical protein [Bradyrhizobium sp.]|uniref:hypothetical protein n=1 Tax=Bradyrhizobium sp. TaxID=376 RepID=UPI0025C62EF7|nr:hypothetical protein [Bradyrhizobium sp.]